MSSDTPRTEIHLVKDGHGNPLCGMDMVPAELSRELERENAQLRAELAKAHEANAELSHWIDDTVQNCSVFKDPPKLNCGAGYLSPEQVKAKCAPLVEALKLTNTYLTNRTFKQVTAEAIAHAEGEGLMASLIAQERKA